MDTRHNRPRKPFFESEHEEEKDINRKFNYETGYPERNTDWFRQHILPSFKKFLKQDNKLLDVGCATGYYTNVLNEYTPSDGIDFAENRVSYAQTKYPHMKFFQADLTSDNFSNQFKEKYDLFFTNAVIPHIPLAMKPKVFNNITQIAKPGALFVLYDALIDDGCRDDFVGLFSLSWLKQNATDWTVLSATHIIEETMEIVLQKNE
jgi:SAM-dependent methyltransferase